MMKLLILLCIWSVFGQKNGKVLLSREVVEERREFEMLLNDILFKSLRPYKCVAILCDEIYYSVLREDVFKNLGLYISYFLILIEDHDDLLSPFPETKEALSSIKKQDCQTYIILIANGIQVSRLLRFGDRYRVLDTRSSFILLYDYRLFETDLHYLWKRIVNVIFIREYHGAKKGVGDHKVIPWFEISTVPFPSPITGVLVPRRLDIWRQGKFRTSVDLFRDKSSDLRNQTIKVATFAHIPAATKVVIPDYDMGKTVVKYGDSAYTGIEIEILASVANAMNFHIELYEPLNADTEYWGNKEADGQYTGLFGEIVKSRADVGLGDFYYTPQILDMMDLSLPYTTECLTFLTPEALRDNSWKTLVLPFKPLMWSIVFLFMFLCGLCFYTLAHVHYKLSEANRDNHESSQKTIQIYKKATKPGMKYAAMKQLMEPQRRETIPEGLFIFGDLTNSFLYTYSMILMVSLPKLPAVWSLRVLTGCYWLYCTLVVVAYRASMTAILANPAARVRIDTLNELADSKLRLGGWGELNREFFLTSLDTISQRIGERFEVINSTDAAVDGVAAGEFALYENTHFLKQATVKRQLRLEQANGSIAVSDRNLHIMEDCVINMPISIGLQKNSPIKPRMDKLIRRVIEAGLIEKWLDDVMQTTLNAETASGDGVKALMSMEKFIGAIVALSVGYFISIGVFIGEMLYFHKVVMKHPNYDKYSKRIYHDKKQ